MPCLRLADPSDSLASAEIVALEATQQPEQWLESRLKYVAQARQETERIRSDRWGLEADFVHPAIVALEQARARLNVLSPGEALDVALHRWCFRDHIRVGSYSNTGVPTPGKSGIAAGHCGEI